MIVANFVTSRPTMSETRTYEDFYKFLGEGLVPKSNSVNCQNS